MSIFIYLPLTYPYPLLYLILYHVPTSPTISTLSLFLSEPIVEYSVLGPVLTFRFDCDVTVPVFITGNSSTSPSTILLIRYFSTASAIAVATLS